jgi:DnaJ-domain-containing protein 1
MSKIPAWLLLALILLYILSPIDLVPDFLGLPGRLDDLLAAIVGYLYLQRSQRDKRGTRGRPRDGRSSPKQGWKGPESGTGADPEDESRPGDPYQILGVSPAASMEEIRSRYRELLLRYHPDRVQHLGKEFQDLADRRTKELNAAFAAVLRERGEKR